MRGRKGLFQKGLFRKGVLARRGFFSSTGEEEGIGIWAKKRPTLDGEFFPSSSKVGLFGGVKKIIWR
jgi:hypothetical protein